MRQQGIEIIVTFQVGYIGDDEELRDDATIAESMTMVLPVMEDKYIVLPKVLEGMTQKAIQAHFAKIEKVLSERIAREKLEAENLKMFDFSRRNPREEE